MEAHRSGISRQNRREAFPDPTSWCVDQQKGVTKTEMADIINEGKHEQPEPQGEGISFASIHQDSVDSRADRQVAGGSDSTVASVERSIEDHAKNGTSEQAAVQMIAQADKRAEGLPESTGTGAGSEYGSREAYAQVKQDFAYLNNKGYSFPVADKLTV